MDYNEEQINRILNYLKDKKEHSTSDISVNCVINQYKVLVLLRYLEKENKVARKTINKVNKWSIL